MNSALCKFITRVLSLKIEFYLGKPKNNKQINKNKKPTFNKSNNYFLCFRNINQWNVFLMSQIILYARFTSNINKIK